MEPYKETLERERRMLVDQLIRADVLLNAAKLCMEEARDLTDRGTADIEAVEEILAHINDELRFIGDDSSEAEK